MKNSKKYLFIGLGMLLIAILFVSYALGHPDAFFPWPLEFTYLFYVAYLIICIKLIFKGLRNKK